MKGRKFFAALAILGAVALVLGTCSVLMMINGGN